jgi:hypothetical protein
LINDGDKVETEGENLSVKDEVRFVEPAKQNVAFYVKEFNTYQAGLHE